MKIDIDKNTVTMKSTNDVEFGYLLDAYRKYYEQRFSKEPSKVEEPKKRKKYLHTLTCNLCGKKVKGPAAMGMHTRMHFRKGENIFG